MNNHNVDNSDNDFDIAIIGMSGRFPGAKNINEFWQNLYSGTESVTFFSDEELSEAGVNSTILTDPNYVKAAPLLEDPELFDPVFFGISPREAKFMDPQHRLFLECAWEALEHAGYDPENFDRPIGVYGGSSLNTYFLFNGLLSNYLSDPLPILLGNDKDYLTTRVSYKLNLKGPSIAVQTACSTSLVAVHIACQSLLNQECDMALAGGVSIRVPQRIGYYYQEGNIFSPDGHCRAFDSKAQGTIFGSGVGVITLKRLEDAFDDGDNILAIIKGSAINNDGASKVDYTAPSVDRQTDVILMALANAQVDADAITYIEAHGTGTAIGDPIEISALTNAFKSFTNRKDFCAIGSVKPNIGHLDAAAGIASLIKTVLALKNKSIPPSINFEEPNPKIDLKNTPFYVNHILSEWNSHPYPRRAGVTSLGVGGTNAHVILEEAPTLKDSDEPKPWNLLVLSAKTQSALDTMTVNLAEHLGSNTEINLTDVSYTLQIGRRSFSNRRILVCKDIKDAKASLTSVDPKRVISSRSDPTDHDVIFMFSGQGSQYPGMGFALYNSEPIFKEALDACAEILAPILSLDLRRLLFPNEENMENTQQLLAQTKFTQPALFVIEYALAKLWMHWGINPQAMVGHSIGEYVAACIAEVFSLEDGLSLVAARGQFMQELPPGSMLAVMLSEKDITPFLNDSLSIAVLNGPNQSVISGENNSIEGLETRLSEKNVQYSRLRTSHAFHSSMMEPILEPFSEFVNNVRMNSPKIPYLSNVTGTWITSKEAMNPDYWAQHLRNTVRFSDCLHELSKEPNRIFLEIGPGNTLSTLAKQQVDRTKSQISLSSIRHPKGKKSDPRFILETLGRLWLAGVKVNWSGYYSNQRRLRVPIPTYPFERKRYWIEGNNRSHTNGSISSNLPQYLDTENPVCKPPYDSQSNRSIRSSKEDEIEHILTSIWQDLLGVDHIDSNDDFFELGGSSLLAVSLFSKIEKSFGQKFPLVTLLDAPTIEQLAAILREESQTTSWSSLVKIQSSGQQPPFFLVHGAGGNILIYRDLANYLGPDQPVFGLQCQGLDGKKPILNSVEEMAINYVNDIKTVQPIGPYLLGGYCLGGSVALEMAQLLTREGEEVALVALFETYNWANMGASSINDKVIHNTQRVIFHLRNFFLLGSDGKLSFLKEKMNVAISRGKVWSGKLFSKLGNNGNEQEHQNILLAQVWETNDRAALKYVPSPYSGCITHFRPIKQYTQNDSSDLGWDNIAKEGVDTHIMPVYPAGMMVEPFVQQLAEELKACIDKAIEEHLTKNSDNPI